MKPTGPNDSLSSSAAESFCAIFEHAAVGIAQIETATGRFVRVNQRCCDILGYSCKEMEQLDVQTLTHPDDLAADLSQMTRLVTGEIRTFAIEKRCRHKDGGVVWVNLTVSSLWPQGEPPSFHVAVVEDITTRRRTEMAEARLVAILENTTDFVSTATPDGKLTYLNKAGRRLDCWGADESLENRLIGDMHPAWASERVEREGLPAAIATGHWEGETAILRRDGREIPVSQVILAHRSPDGVLEYFSTIIRDISERRRVEQELRALATRQHALLAAIPDIVMEVDDRKVYTWGNRPGIEFFGDDVIGKEASCYFEGEQTTYRAVQPLFDGSRDVIYVESWQRRRDGEKRLLAWWCRVLEDEQGHVKGAISSARDITEQRASEEEGERLQEELTQAQKTEAVGRLAGGVAHDFNNMVQVILGNAALALEGIPPGSGVRDNLEEIQKSAQRSADLTRQLLAFARRQPIQPKVLDLNDTVAGMLKMLRRLIGEDIDLAWVPAENLWPVKLDPSQIDRVLANLCLNARDAIAGAGRVTIETANVTLDDTYALHHPECTPGAYVVLTVSDTGKGVDAATRTHLFEPFFTTKELGKGTGLGLATVFGIVKQNHGLINVDSEPGRGTTFKIYLPRTESELVPAATVPVRRSLRGTETVLLVEDEEQVLRLGRHILEHHGYAVLSASTPEAALALAAKQAGPIDLLVTDVVMPSLNGRELFDRLRASRPALRCLFMSGYTANVIAHRGVLDVGVHFLQKPFTIQTLAEKAREALEQPPTP